MTMAGRNAPSPVGLLLVVAFNLMLWALIVAAAVTVWRWLA